MAGMRDGMYLDGQSRIRCKIKRIGSQNTRIVLEDGSEKLVPSELVTVLSNFGPQQDDSSVRLIPTVPLETFYRPLRKLTGTPKAKYQALHALLNGRHGPTGAEFLSELFRRSVRHAEEYANVEEAFYPQRTTRTSASDFAKLFVEKVHLCKPIEISVRTITFVDYEIFPFRTTRSCNELGMPASRAGSGGMDLLLASTYDNKVLPAIGEIKANTEQVGPTFALVQSLMYASQLVTKNQFLRLKRHYPVHFSNLEEDQPKIDIAVFLEKDSMVDTEDLNYALSLAERLVECLSGYLRYISFFSCYINEDEIVCDLIERNGGQ